MKIIIDTDLTKYEIEIESIPKQETKDECLGVKVIVDNLETYSGILEKDMQNLVN